MTRVAWERYEGNDIEAVVAMLINLDHPNSVRITPSRGDGGVDILDRGAAANGGDVVYQVKRYTGPLSTAQQKNVEESRTRLQADPRWGALNVQEWCLVTPWDPTPEAESWLQGLDDSARSIVWHGLTYIEARAAKYPEVIDYYMEGGKSRIGDAYQAVVAMLAPADASAELDVRTVATRLATALAVLDGDPHYRYELRLGEGQVPDPAMRPNLVMTWIQSEGPGKPWQAVDVIARCAASVDVRPIVVSGTVNAEGGSDLATALQDFVDFGTPFETPMGAFEGNIDAPGGLGGPLANAAIHVLSLGDVVGADPDLILSARSVDGVPIAETEVRRVERSEGTKGLRVMLQQKNKVFTVEDRYSASDGGTRRLRFGDYSNQPATEVRDALAFISAVAPPNSVYVRRKGSPPQSASVDPNWTIDLPNAVREVLDGIAAPVALLARLQQHTGNIVRVPDLTETTVAQVEEWRRAATILEGEEVIVAYAEGHALGVELPADVDTIPRQLAIEVPLNVPIGQQTINFGTALAWLDNATVLGRGEIDGRTVQWLTTPGRRVRYSLRKDGPGVPPG